MLNARNEELQLRRVLVVVTPDQFESGALADIRLLSRALVLAASPECELDFVLVRDGGLSLKDHLSLSPDPQPVEGSRDSLASADLADLVARLSDQGISSTCVERLDVEPLQAVLQQIHEARPDIVLKRSEAHDYLLGLFTNIDWELVRRSPVHVWFVTDDSAESIDRVATAIESNAAEEGRVAARDCLAFHAANEIADRYAAQNIPVHAYQVPEVAVGAAAAAPGLAAYSQVSPAEREQMRHQAVNRHLDCVRPFAEYFQIPLEEIRLVEGEPSEAIPLAAENYGAGLIVMAARFLGRMERILDTVNAEPVLARAPCDVVFVKEELRDSRQTIMDMLP